MRVGGAGGAEESGRKVNCFAKRGENRKEGAGSEEQRGRGSRVRDVSVCVHAGCTLALCSAARGRGSAAGAPASPQPAAAPRAPPPLPAPRGPRRHGPPHRRPLPPPVPAPVGAAAGSLRLPPRPPPLHRRPRGAVPTTPPPHPTPPGPAATFSRGQTSRPVPREPPAAASPLAALPSGASPPPHPVNGTPSLRPRREPHAAPPTPRHKCTITGGGREGEERARDAKKEGGKGEREEKLKGHKAVHHQHGCLSSDLKEE